MLNIALVAEIITGQSGFRILDRINILHNLVSENLTFIVINEHQA